MGFILQQISLTIRNLRVSQKAETFNPTQFICLELSVCSFHNHVALTTRSHIQAAQKILQAMEGR